MNKSILLKILLFIGWLFFITCTATGSAQAQNNQTAQMKKAKAAWTSFYAKFSRAVSSRNRKALKSMWSPQTDDYSNEPDEAVNNWIKYDQRTILKTKPSPFTFFDENDNRVVRTIEWGSMPCCTIRFTFSSDDKWYITYYDCGCTA